MPIIKVWRLPKAEEVTLKRLEQMIIQAVLGVPELGIKAEKDVTCIFPSDMMQHDAIRAPADDIIVEVTGLNEKSERTEEVRNRLAERVGRAVNIQFPATELVECFIYSFNSAQGFWSSRSQV